MALLDISACDLSTPMGQAQALSDLIDEMNGSTADSQLLNYINIAAYGNLVLNIPQNYVASASHGLGYKPAFILWWEDASNVQGIEYQLVPALFGNTQPISLANQFYGYVDSQNIYAVWQNGGSSATTINFFFYVFNLPMPT